MFVKYFHAFSPQPVQLIAHGERSVARSEEIGASLQKYQSPTFRDTRLVRFRDWVSSIYLERDPARK